MWRQLGLSGVAEPAWDEFAPRRLPGGLTAAKPEPIFPRIDIDKVKAQQAQRQAVEAEEKQAASEAARRDNMISFKEFQRIDLRVGKVVEAQRIEGTDKLLKLMVDIGEEEPRQIVAGLAPAFGPEDLLGKNVVIVANLEPARIRGVESRGMLLAAGEDEPLALVVVDRDCPPGTKVR